MYIYIFYDNETIEFSNLKKYIMKFWDYKSFLLICTKRIKIYGNRGNDFEIVSNFKIY